MRNINRHNANTFFLFVVIATSLVLSGPASAQNDDTYNAYKIHHCKGEVYQSEPCPESSHSTSTSGNVQNAPVASNSVSSHVGQRLTLNFQSIKVRSLLKLIADINLLTIDMDDNRAGSILTSAAYVNAYSGDVLNDIANKYNFKVNIKENRLIITTPDDIEYDSLVKRLEQEYPIINPDSPRYDQSVIAEMKRQMVDYQRSHVGVGEVEALERVYPSILKADAASPSPVDAQAATPAAGYPMRRVVLSSLGAVLPPFLLGVFVIGGVWIVVALIRRRRRKVE